MACALEIARNAARVFEKKNLKKKKKNNRSEKTLSANDIR